MQSVEPACKKTRHHAWGPDDRCLLCQKQKDARGSRSPRALGDLAARLNALHPAAAAAVPAGAVPSAPAPEVATVAVPVPAAAVAALVPDETNAWIARRFTQLFIDAQQAIAEKRGKKAREPETQDTRAFERGLGRKLQSWFPDGGPLTPGKEMLLAGVLLTLEIQCGPKLEANPAGVLGAKSPAAGEEPASVAVVASVSAAAPTKAATNGVVDPTEEAALRYLSARRMAASSA